MTSILNFPDLLLVSTSLNDLDLNETGAICTRESAGNLTMMGVNAGCPVRKRSQAVVVFELTCICSGWQKRSMFMPEQKP